MTDIKDAETLVLCPGCGKGLISYKLAAKLRTVLGGPESEEDLTQVNTDIMPVLKEGSDR